MGGGRGREKELAEARKDTVFDERILRQGRVRSGKWHRVTNLSDNLRLSIHENGARWKTGYQSFVHRMLLPLFMDAQTQIVAQVRHAMPLPRTHSSLSQYPFIKNCILSRLRKLLFSPPPPPH